MADPDGGQGTLELGTFGGRRNGKALAEAPAPGVDSQLAAGLGVDEIEKPDVRQLLLAWIAHLDSYDVVMPREFEERAPPLAIASKVGHDDDQRTLTRERPRTAKRARECRRARAFRRRFSAKRGQQPDESDATLPWW